MLREFFDGAGTFWCVWDVYPSIRRGDEPQSSEKDADPKPPRAIPNPMGAFASGWLCFLSLTEKRRLAPIPRGWDTCDDAELQRLCSCAECIFPPPNESELEA